MDIDLLRRDECPQQFTSEQVTAIKNAVKGRRGNVNITPYHIYDYDEHKVGEWRETIDGVKKCKPVYERTVYDVTLASKGNTTVYSFDNAIVDKLIKINISTSTFNSNNRNECGLSDMFEARCSNNQNIVVENIVTGVWGGCTVVFQYTKTTDEWEVVVE